MNPLVSQRTLLGFAAMFAAMFASVSSYVRAHAFHTTLAKIHYRPLTKRLEVALLVKENDLHRALTHANLPLNQPAIETYLQRTFRVHQDDHRKELQYLGSENERRGTWLYFSIEGLSSLEGAILEHKVLLATEPQALNTVHFYPPHDGSTWVQTLSQQAFTVSLSSSKLLEPKAIKKKNIHE